jgi:hypothetical protein
VAQAAILYLSLLPDRGGADADEGFDEVILDEERPLLVRLAAARARAPEGRPEALQRLAEDAHTHPALRRALGP